jgi:hypothetical protein
MVRAKAEWWCAAICVMFLFNNTWASTGNELHSTEFVLKRGHCNFTAHGYDYDLCTLLGKREPSQTVGVRPQVAKNGGWKLMEGWSVTIRLGGWIEEGLTGVCRSHAYRTCAYA